MADSRIAVAQRLGSSETCQGVNYKLFSFMALVVA